MVLPEWLPYELIGKTVVALVALCLAILLLVTVVFVVLFVWVRGLAWISSRMWDGHDHDENKPPLWKLRVSGVTLALSRFKFRKVRAAYQEADDIANDEKTVREYLKSVFLS